LKYPRDTDKNPLAADARLPTSVFARVYVYCYRLLLRLRIRVLLSIGIEVFIIFIRYDVRGLCQEHPQQHNAIYRHQTSKTEG
jgi:hypothetical protein